LKTLIINGSPRKNGDTAALISEFKKHITGEVTEISAYYDKIKPCIDCRYCWKQKGCVIKDDMAKIYDDDFDTVVIASPVYMSTLPGPLVSLASRFQSHYAAKRFLKDKIDVKSKNAVLLLTGGDILHVLLLWVPQILHDFMLALLIQEVNLDHPSGFPHIVVANTTKFTHSLERVHDSIEHTRLLTDLALPAVEQQ
jgi:multimeric flavodoxin WrbA